MRRILHGIGIVLIVAWLVLWLAVKITFAAVHLLVVLGLVLIIAGLMKSKASGAT